MIYTTEVQHMCPVAKGAYHGPAPIPEEGKWVQAKEISDISGFTHGIGWCAPQQGACKLTLNNKNGIIEEALVEQDEILVFGPDLTELRGDSAYARIALLRVGDIESDDEDDTEQAFRAIQDMDFVKYHVFPKGYMIRTSSESNREQVRLSSAALKKGISFRAVGNDFIRQYKQNPNILAVKLIFITAPDADYAALEQEAKTVRDITMSLSKILEGMPTDCGSCNLKPICDEVEGMRELHFGKEKHTTE